jgi:hypothetical protein
MRRSFESKVNHLHSHVFYILLEGRERGVAWQLQTIEACVALGIWVDGIIWHHLYMKLLVFSPITLKILKAQDRHTTIPSHEMQ